MTASTWRVWQLRHDACDSFDMTSVRSRVFQKLAATVLASNWIVLWVKINYFLIIDSHANTISVYSSMRNNKVAIRSYKGNKKYFKTWNKLCQLVEYRKDVTSFHQKIMEMFIFSWMQLIKHETLHWRSTSKKNE